MQFRRDGSHGAEVALAIFIGRADHRQLNGELLVFFVVTGCLLLAYLLFGTRLKYKRVRREKAQFSALQRGFNKLMALDASRIRELRSDVV